MASYFTKFGKGKEFSLVDGNEEKITCLAAVCEQALICY